MTEEQRKALTEYLGECWDADKRPGGDLPNRTFTTDADMMALFRKMVDKGEYDSFYLPLLSSLWHRKGDALFSTWLFYDPERFCCLVAQWLEEKK